MIVRSLGWKTDLALRRLGGSVIEDKGDALVVRTPHNPGFRWGNFVLLRKAPTAADAPRWMERYAEWFPDSTHVAIGVDATHGSKTELAALAALGLDTEESTVLTARDVHLPPHPNLSAQVRALSSPADWELSLQLDLDTSDEPVDDGYRVFAERRVAERKRMVADGKAMWFGAFDRHGLRSQLGLVDAGDGLARFQQVETHPDARGRGLAGTLVHYASGYGFSELRASQLVMVADPEYHAIGIYRSVGFRDTHTQLQAERHD